MVIISTSGFIWLLTQLNRDIFPGNPIKFSIERTEEGNKRAGGILCEYRRIGEEEWYIVYSRNLDYEIWNNKKLRLLCIEDILKAHSWEELLPLYGDEFVTYLAAHEMRHRVQQHYLKLHQLFSPHYLKEKEKAKDMNLQAIVLFEALALNRDAFGSEEEFLQEFDADVIGLYTAVMSHKGKYFKDIVKIIKEDARNIWSDNY